MADNPYDQFDAPANPYDQFDSTAKPRVQSFDVLADGTRVLTGSPEAIAARSPVAGQHFAQNAVQGVGKLYTDALLGARQLYAQVTGGDQNSVVDPVTGMNAAEKRNIDAPLQATGGAKVGEIAGALPLGFLAAPTLGSAAVFGAGMGAVQPTLQNESRLLNTGVGAATGIAAQYGGSKLGSWLTTRSAEPIMGWTPGYANKVAAQSIGSDAKNLSQPAIAEANQRIGGVFNQVRSPNVSTTLGNDTLTAIDSAGKPLNRSVRDALENNDNVSELLQFAANGKPATAEQLGQISSKLGNDAKVQMTSRDGDRALGRALFNLQNHVDDEIGKTITDPKLAASYATARQQYRSLAQLTTNPTILNSATGDVNMTALGKYLQRSDKPGYLRGGNQSELYQAARWGQATGEGKGAPPLDLGGNLGLKYAGYYLANNPVSRGIGGAVSRLGAPVAPVIRQGVQGVGLGSVPFSGAGLNGLLPYLTE
jgi:hypothetical protein